MNTLYLSFYLSICIYLYIYIFLYQLSIYLHIYLSLQPLSRAAWSSTLTRRWSCRQSPGPRPRSPLASSNVIVYKEKYISIYDKSQFTKTDSFNLDIIFLKAGSQKDSLDGLILPALSLEARVAEQNFAVFSLKAWVAKDAVHPKGQRRWQTDAEQLKALHFYSTRGKGSLK